MIYLDSGCLVKLYYPEPESAQVARLVAGQPIVYLSLHELELRNALELKLFRKEGRPSQVRAVQALVAEDLRAGALHRPAISWDDVLDQATTFTMTHTRKLGCRSLDILHCAAALLLSATAFVSTDDRQRRLAAKIGLSCPEI